MSSEQTQEYVLTRGTLAPRSDVRTHVWRCVGADGVWPYIDPLSVEQDLHFVDQ